METITGASIPRQTTRDSLVLYLVGGVALLAFGGYWLSQPSLSAALTAVLLSLTGFFVLFLVVDGESAALSRKLACLEVPKAVFLAVYIFGAQLLKKHLLIATLCSALALVFAVMLTIALVGTARAMIRTKQVARGSRLRELLADKVVALTAFLIVFLHVAYALTFALAFRDRFVGGELYAVEYAKPLPTATTDHAPKPPAEPEETPACSGAKRTRTHKFFFGESSATLACTARWMAAAATDKVLRNEICSGGVDARMKAFRDVGAAECDAVPATAPLVRRGAACNVRELYEMRSVFRQLTSEAKSYLVEIRGHANDTRVRSEPSVAYASNYEISKQRADQIAVLLDDLFQDASKDVPTPAIRWLPYGVSNENSFLDPDSGDWADAALDPKLSVEVSVQTVADSFEGRHLREARTTPRRLDLIDYLYFLVYTITTTGYGDIIPTSSYARFIVTLANLIELLFVVVLVNVIANARLAPATSATALPEGDDHAARP